MPHADGHQPTNQNDFAALLAAEPEEGIDLLGPTSASIDDPKLRQAVAEVFNAHGFFPSDSERSDTPVTAQANTADAEARRQPAAQIAFLPNASDRDKSLRIDRPGQIDFGSRPTSSTGREVVLRQVSRALPSQQPTVLVSVAGIPTSARAAIAGTAGDASEPLYDNFSPPRQAAASSTADRLILQIGTHVVQLTGRMQGLGKDEQEQLVARLTALLESHGLRIGAAMLNGRPLREAILRSNH